jgi:hypothetical protein
MKIIVQGVLVFIIVKTMAKMLKLPKISINNLLAKPTKEKEKEKEVAIYQKIAPPETLVDQEG